MLGYCVTVILYVPIFSIRKDRTNPHSSSTCRACRKPGIRSLSSGRFESCGQPCCQQLLNGTMQAAPVFAKSTGQGVTAEPSLCHKLCKPECYFKSRGDRLLDFYIRLFVQARVLQRTVDFHSADVTTELLRAKSFAALGCALYGAAALTSPWHTYS